MLLFVHVADLEPDIGMRERVRRVPEDAVEAVERLGVLALLLVDYAESEQDFVRLVKI